MRHIDNYTDKEREILAFKGMTAPRTASERMVPEILSSTGKPRNLEKTAGYQPQANKAQHSPLPWTIREHQRPERETVTYEAGNTFGIYKTNNESVFWAVADEIENEADAKLIVASVNHADKLAEALRWIKEVVSERKGTAMWLQMVEDKTRNALRDYEAAQ